MYEEYDFDRVPVEVHVEVPAEAVRMQEKVDTTPAKELTPLLRATAFMRVKGWSRPPKVMRATHAAYRLDQLYSRM